jgi:hypothetical protein
MNDLEVSRGRGKISGASVDVLLRLEFDEVGV